MRKLTSIFILLFIITIHITNAQSMSTFKDDRDGHIYKTVTIGEQTWLAENFSYKPINGVYYIYDNDINNLKQYGYLYDWETAKAIAPEGWRLPNKDDFQILVGYFSEPMPNKKREDFNENLTLFDPFVLHDRKIIKGDSIINMLYFASPDSTYKILAEGGKSNMNFVPAGYYIGNFNFKGESSGFWSATDIDDSNSWYFRLNDNRMFYMYKSGKRLGFSVRYIKI